MDGSGAVVEPAPYLPYRDGPARRAPEEFRWRLGLRPLAGPPRWRDWIELGPGAEEAIAAKASLSRQHADVVLATIDDGIVDESNEVAATLVAHLRRRWPERFAAVRLDPDLHPLDAAARLVPEDLVVLAERAGRLVFGGGSVCFPNRWDLRSKLGKSMTEVHQPVPRLNDQLATAIDQAIARLRPERGYWRLGWTLIDTADQFTPVAAGAARHGERGGAMYVRVERETLRRLPETRCVLFTIRTYVTEVRAVTSDDVAADELAAAVGSWPRDVLAYKGLADVAGELVRSLEDRGQHPDRI